MGKLFVFTEDLSVQKWCTAGCGGNLKKSNSFILSDSNNLKTGQETSGYFTVHLECLSNLAWLLHKGGTTKNITRNWLKKKSNSRKRLVNGVLYPFQNALFFQVIIILSLQNNGPLFSRSSSWICFPSWFSRAWFSRTSSLLAKLLHRFSCFAALSGPRHYLKSIFLRYPAKHLDALNWLVQGMTKGIRLGCGQMLLGGFWFLLTKITGLWWFKPWPDFILDR